MDNYNKGFAIVLSVLLFLTMSVMASILVLISLDQNKKNRITDNYQQSFYTAETALMKGQDYLKNLSNPPSSNSVNFSGNTCSDQFLNFLTPTTIIYRKNDGLENIIAYNNNEELEEMKQYNFEFIIKFEGSGTSSKNSGEKSGESIDMGSGYNQTQNSSAEVNFYRIYGCGIHDSGNTAAIEALVSISK